MKIIQFKSNVRDYIWGGTKLKNKYHKKSKYNEIAESWELSAHCGTGEQRNLQLRNRLLRRVDPCGFVNASHPAKKLRADCKKSRPLYCNFAQNSVQYTVYIRNEQNLDYKTR